MSLITRSVDHYKLVAGLVAAVTALVVMVVALPILMPDAMGFMHTIQVDTDPENMLADDEPVRLFHDDTKSRLDLHDIVVVGIVNRHNPDGVFNPDSLRKVYELTALAGQLTGDTELGRKAGLVPGEGVIAADIIAPSTVDNIIPGEDTIRFEWLMPSPPESPQQAREVLSNARRIPFLSGTMVPPDVGQNQAVCLYLPISSKDISYRVYKALHDKADQLGGPEEYYITGLPVAEDTFGVEMFIQMAISAPTAMVIIFVLMLVFFRKLVLIISPMIVAMVSVVITMGGLIAAGFPIHIMSSMIPIFIMPIAVLDSIHIISEFFEKYPATRDRRKTIMAVMDDLFMPMLYTSLTSAAGFASLALTPIPPVQVFGVAVAGGVMVAWLLTILFIPAYVMFISPKTLANFGAARSEEGENHSTMARMLRGMGAVTHRRAKPILAVTLIILAVAGYGISRIVINDNPIKWFAPSHPIRQADRVLNQHFGGTYMAYLALEADAADLDAGQYAEQITAGATRHGRRIAEVVERFAGLSAELAAASDSYETFFRQAKDRLRPNMDTAGDEEVSAFAAMTGFLDRQQDRLEFAEPPIRFDKTALPADLSDRARQFSAAVVAAVDGIVEAAERQATDAAGTVSREQFLDAVSASLRQEPGTVGQLDGEIADAAMETAEAFIAEHRQASEVFKRPDVLAYLKELGAALAQVQDGEGKRIVGKSNSLAEIVETVNRDLHGGRTEYQRIPNTRKAVGSCITQFQSGHRPQDLAHFVTTADYRLASMWVQLVSGDNKDMARVVSALDQYIADNPPPIPLRHQWFGLTYINVIWQDKMVTGMLEAFAGSFLVVFLLMTVLFRSALWGLLSMIPLTVTIAAIYGVAGLVGKDYDMPTAVLSSLTLGLAVDFAIHFLVRSRAARAQAGNWQQAAPAVFGEPARAIVRNIIVIATGFLPLVLAPLVPYKTVGILLATILLVSGLATLLLLPALIRLLDKPLFPSGRVMGLACNCGTCLVSAVALAALVAINVHRYLNLGLNGLAIGALAIVIIVTGACALLSRRQACRMASHSDQKENDK